MYASVLRISLAATVLLFVAECHSTKAPHLVRMENTAEPYRASHDPYATGYEQADHHGRSHESADHYARTHEPTRINEPGDPYATSLPVEKRYTANWAVEIMEGGDEMADKIASKYGFHNLGKIDGLHGIYNFQLQEANLKTDSPNRLMSNELLSEQCVSFAEQQIIKPREKKSYEVPQDPLFPFQWSLLNSGQFGVDYKGNDSNVEKAWLQGLSGCGVTVTVVDDGLYYHHRDLWDNYVPQSSFNFWSYHEDPSTSYPWHGTNCGGIIGAAKDEKTCGVGIAYNCNLGGIALLQYSTDLNEARSFTYENCITDIYSNSWGPYDDGHTVDGPEYLAKEALKNGVKEGRKGKGSIFVFANGNGGDEDDCAADGYSSSIYTISVGSIGVDGTPSYYDEKCSSKMVVTYVTDLYGSSSVSTTDLDGCTLNFGGTSAAAPIASGIIALVLEANKELTWRDVQYLIVYTSNPMLSESIEFESTTNGAGLQVSRHYGFGVMDAEAMVTRARHWINVPPQVEQYVIPATQSGRATFDTPFTTTIRYTGTIHYLEHVVIEMSLDISNTSSYGRRGDIRIELTSPSKTLSILLDHRLPWSFYHYYRDDRDVGQIYSKWPFMSVMFWGEDPTGEWNLVVLSGDSNTEVEVYDVKFQFFGLHDKPESVVNIPTKCHHKCLRGCAKAGSKFCDACVNLRNAYTLECIDRCPRGYTERNGYCYDANLPIKQCISPLKELKKSGSCVDAAYDGCCVDEYCGVTAGRNSLRCFCDAHCHKLGDCCDDIDLINCPETTDATKTLHYIELGTSPTIETQTVSRYESEPIFVEFPFGASNQSKVHVRRWGYFRFDNFSSGYVAPFWPYRGYWGGLLNYEIHTADTSELLLASIDSIINEEMGTDFHGEWLLIAKWDSIPESFGISNITNTFQGILATDFVRSFAVFIYKCGDLESTSGAYIGFNTRVGLYATHIATQRRNAKAIACWNSPKNPWVNVVYKLTTPRLCPDLADIYQGGVWLDGNIPGSIAHYWCSYGYQLVGNRTRICQDDGLWSDDEPFCDCISKVRLRGGWNSCQGRVEVCHDRQWGTVCDNSWDISEAHVVCSQLSSCGSAIAALSNAQFGEGREPILMDNVACTGRETSLQACPFNGWGVHNCVHGEDAGVICEAMCYELISPINGNVTWTGLTSGSTATYTCDSGYQLEGFHSRTCSIYGYWSRWPPYCIRLCNALPSPANGNVTWFGLTSGSEAIYTCDSGYQLTGYDYRICLDTGMWSGQAPNCTRVCDVLTAPDNGRVTWNGITNGSTATYTCDKGYELIGDRTRTCLNTGEWSGQEPNCTVRLVGGANICEGRVEVYHYGQWGTVCDDFWGMPDAKVVCSQVYCGPPVKALRYAHFGPGSGPIWMDNVDCTGEEAYLQECQFGGWRDHNCYHEEDASVICQTG